ncbi:MAG: GerW family sporulation protein, partial [bacterium]
MEKHPTNELMETVINKVHELVNVSTVIGEPIISPDGTTLIPVSRLSFGFASGGSDVASKNLREGEKKPFGGGSGAGVKIDPVAFVVIKDGNVRIM